MSVAHQICNRVPPPTAKTNWCPGLSTRSWDGEWAPCQLVRRKEGTVAEEMFGPQNANRWQEDQEKISVMAAILDRCSLIPHSSHWAQTPKADEEAFRLCGYFSHPTTTIYDTNIIDIQLTLMFSCNRAYTVVLSRSTDLLRRNISNPPLHVCRSHSQTPTRILLSNYMSTVHSELRTECWLKWWLFVLLCSIQIAHAATIITILLCGTG